MKLHYKTHIMISLVIIGVVAFISLVINNQSKASLETQMGNAAMDMAYTISAIPEIQIALAEQRKSGEIQSRIQPLMERTRYQYIIVMDMDRIQYSYPYSSGVYKEYKNGGEGPAFEIGAAYISADINRLISAIRAFHPVYYNEKQVGVVLVALLTDEIQKENQVHRKSMEASIAISVFAGIIIAYFFSLNIKKSIFGLEPKEIAILLSEKEMILQNIEKGILAINNNGKITVGNFKANELLGIELKGVEKEYFIDIEPCLKDAYTRTYEFKERLLNETCILKSGKRILLNTCFIRNPNEDIIGVIMSLDELTEARRIAEELTNYKSIVDSLRAQNHEFMNKLQVLSGLIQLEKFEESLSYIEHQTKRSKNFNKIISEGIEDSKIAALIISKYEKASEKKILFLIDESSRIIALPKSVEADEICTIMGNLIDNSIDAVSDVEEKYIKIFFRSDENKFEFNINNSGPYIESDFIFQRGYSSKGENRGYGLYNIKRILDNIGGKISWSNSEEVTWYVCINADEGSNC